MTVLVNYRGPAAPATVLQANIMNMTQESLEGLRPLLDSLSDGVCISDAQGKLLYANAAAGRLLGLGRKEAQEETICTLLCGRMDGVDCGNCPLKVAAGAEDAVTYEGSYHGSGDPRSLRVRCLRVRRPRGDRHFLVVEDVRSEAELIRRQEDWRHMFAHDLRSPLTNVLGVLRMIEEKGEGRPIAAHDVEMISLAVRSCVRIRDLLDSYLTVARMREGKMPVNLAPTDVGALVERCFKEEGARVKDKERTLERDGPFRGGAGGWGSADPELLYRVILNLIDNAVKFTMTGGAVRVSVEPQDGWVAVRVADDGAGIAPEDLPHIFDRFHQAKGTPRGVGFGLGLTFCRQAMAAMGGEIGVESEVGRGSAFTLRVRSCAAPGGGS